MSKTTGSLTQLIDQYDIDIYELLKYLDESIHREEQFLALTENFSTIQSTERTLEILSLLKRLKKGVLNFCRHARLLPLTSRHHSGTDYLRQINALKFLLLAKEFPSILDELSP